MTPRFDMTDFNSSWDSFARAEYLPKLARVAFGLTDSDMPEAKAKRIAIKAAEESLRFMRAYVARQR